MSKDIKINWSDSLLEGDFTFDESIQDFESDEGLETAVIISLFSDRRAADDDILPDENNPNKRGWWGDLVSERDQIGSRLWLLDRSKTTSDILVKAKQYAEEALKWMVDDGVAAKIVVETERQGDPGKDQLIIGVKIHRWDGTIKENDFTI